MAPLLKLIAVLLPAMQLLGVSASPIGDFSVTASGIVKRDYFNHVERRGVVYARASPFLTHGATPAGRAVQNGVKLRILPVGDSITVGTGKGADGNGYRKRLKQDLSENEVVFAGTQKYTGDLKDGYFAAWSGKTIKFISDSIGPSLKHRPNMVLLAAGTNDMNSDPKYSKEGTDPRAASHRLRALIDKIAVECPDATILVSMIINTCNTQAQGAQLTRTKIYRTYVANVVKSARKTGVKVIAVDFGPFKTTDLSDCVHPNRKGYEIMGDWWYDFIHQIPKGWIKAPVGPDPKRG
ncbi:hypothetical protein F66182_10528 [Fusarium sp. NRRL 66182]|nr:hypothetical protein F66182_10528 [Fusarium sp. NRRL 66182]